MLSAIASAALQGSANFVGTLDSTLTPGVMRPALALTPATDDARRKVQQFVTAGDTVLVSTFETVGRTSQPIYLIVHNGTASVLTDLNRDGSLQASERVALGASRETGIELDATLRFPTPDAPYPEYPVRVGLASGELAAITNTSRANEPTILWISLQDVATGVVSIDGQPTKFQIAVEPQTFSIDLAHNFQYLDTNRDGTFDESPTSWEAGLARGEAVVFHVGEGNRYVSMSSIDLAHRTLTFANRSASDYTRIELRIGGTVPDFQFTELDGTIHHLSEYRGKYVLLDFWGTWCGPCRANLPFLRKTYQGFKDRGFEIIGMDNEIAMQNDVTAAALANGADKARAFVREQGVTWPNAQTASIKTLFETRFRISAWPTMVLLDPQDRIVSVNRTDRGEPGLRGVELDRTLSSLLK